ncbi:MAG: hypothetical protein IJW21_08095 [Clostridia bacterium]|nr:hypothetical protein [Clostridia bacterium]
MQKDEMNYEKMTAYDATEAEQGIIDNIPAAVASKDSQKMHSALRELYLKTRGADMIPPCSSSKNTFSDLTNFCFL